MNRNHRSSVAEFFEGFQGGQRIAQAYKDAKKDGELEDLAKEKVDTTNGYSAEDGAQLEAAANAKDENGNPYYKVGTNEKGKYTITPVNAARVPTDSTDPTAADMEQAAPRFSNTAPVEMATKDRHTFMGKTYDQAPTEQQISAVRSNAQAGILDRYGDLEGASRVRNQARQGLLTDMQIGQAQRQETRDKNLETHEGLLRDVDQQVADYTKGKITGPDGTMRDMTNDDLLDAGHKKVSLLIGAGKLDDANKLASNNLQMLNNKIQVETAQRNEALGIATASGDLNAFKDFHNKFVPDSTTTTSIVPNKNGSITVNRVDMDGNEMAPHVFKDAKEMQATMQSISDPKALANYSANAFNQQMQEKQLKISQSQLGLSQAAGARAQTEYDDGASDRKLKKTISDLTLTAGTSKDPAEQTAAMSQLKAIQAGMPKGQTPYKVESGDVTTLLGTPAVDEKGKPLYDPLTGKQQINRNVEEEAKFLRWMAKEGITDTNKGLARYIGENVPGASANKMTTDPKALAIRDDKSMTIDQKKAKLADLGYK